MSLNKELLMEGNISLKDKYFSFKNEKRIRRVQFFYRMIIPGILLAIFSMIPTFIAGMLSPEYLFYVMIIIQIIYILLIIKYYPYIIQKRAHDFNKKGKIETYILVGTAIFSSLTTVYSYYLMINMDMIQIMKIAGISQIIGLLSFITFLYLLFRSGTKGVNEYGEQKYYSIKFLG